MVQPSELLNQAWNKPKLKHRSPHVVGSIERFNRISNWVSREILAVPYYKDRREVLHNIIKITQVFLFMIIIIIMICFSRVSLKFAFCGTSIYEFFSEHQQKNKKKIRFLVMPRVDEMRFPRHDRPSTRLSFFYF